MKERVRGISREARIVGEWAARYDREVAPTGAGWISVREAAAMLGIQPRSMERLMTRGQIDYWQARSGGRRVVCRESVEAEIARRKERQDEKLARVQGSGFRVQEEDEGIGGDDLITVREAAEILGVGEQAVRELLWRKRLTVVDEPRRMPVERSRMGPKTVVVRCWLRRGEVERLVRKREAAREVRTAELRVAHWGSRGRRPMLDGGESLINTAQAAAILGVSPQRMVKLAAKGHVPVYQQRPGKSGSRLWFRAGQVGAMLRWPERLRRREAFEKGRDPKVKRYIPKPWRTPGWQGDELHVVNARMSGPATRKDRGEFFSTRQVARMLGVGVPRVLELRRTGKLHGLRLPQKPSRKGHGNLWWFFTKAQVYALQEDPAYCRRRRAYELGLRRAEEAKLAAPTLEELDAMRKANAFQREPRTPLMSLEEWRLGMLGEVDGRWAGWRPQLGFRW